MSERRRGADAAIEAMNDAGHRAECNVLTRNVVCTRPGCQTEVNPLCVDDSACWPWLREWLSARPCKGRVVLAEFKSMFAESLNVNRPAKVR